MICQFEGLAPRKSSLIYVRPSLRCRTQAGVWLHFVYLIVVLDISHWLPLETIIGLCSCTLQMSMYAHPAAADLLLHNHHTHYSTHFHSEIVTISLNQIHPTHEHLAHPCPYIIYPSSRGCDKEGMVGASARN